MQAARGTPLNDGETGGVGDDASSRGDRSGRRFRVVFALVALAAYLVDQVTKTIALRELTDRAPVEVVGEWFRLTLVFNPGAAFSLGTSATVLLSIFAIVAASVVLWVSRRLGDPVWAVGLGLLLGGILGNLTDRLFRDPSPLRGHVIDFLQLPNWPVFNFADIWINLAAAVIVLQAFRGVNHRGERTEPRDEEGA